MNANPKLLNEPIAPPKSPIVEKPYWVQCQNYRCLALVNKQGVWKSLSTGKEVTGIVKVYFEEC